LGLQYSKYKIFFARLLEYMFLPTLLFIRAKRQQKITKILIIEPFNLGDAISISVIIDPLREKFQDADIHLLLKKVGTKIYEKDERIKKIITYEFPWAKRRDKFNLKIIDFVKLFFFLILLKKEKYDIAIDCRGEIRTQIVMALIGCPIRVGYTNYLCSNIIIKGLLLTHNAGKLSPKPRALLNLETIKLLGCDISNRHYKLKTPYNNANNSNEFNILCHCGAGWEHRLWPADNWALLLKKITEKYCVKVKVIASEKEKSILQKIEVKAPTYAYYYSTSLNQLINFIQQSNLFICLDSGPMHLAAALDKPIIGLFGPGFIDLWRPFCKKHIILHHQEAFSCAPCLQSKCFHADSNCMEAITVSEVFNAIMNIIPEEYKLPLCPL
jgi:ADP-heptose:LPS heptosyltransferase